jgi:hypothetical protein
VLITAGADNTIRIFKGLDDEDAQTLDNHSEPVTALAIKVRLLLLVP